MATPTTDIASSPSGGETVSSYKTYEEAERGSTTCRTTLPIESRSPVRTCVC
jgi:hypothetical protein